MKRFLLFALALSLAGCGRPSGAPADRSEKPDLGPPQAGSRPGGSAETSTPIFTDVTASTGIRFSHNNGASPRKYLPETMGSGVAVFDFDNDDLPDIYFVNAGPVTSSASPPGVGALYKNLGGTRFRDVTVEAGLDGRFVGMGAAVGDWNNDGWADLFVSGLGGDRLFKNLGHGRFSDVTDASGLSNRGFGTSAAFLDYDRDGWLDLFVGRYVRWSRETDSPCAAPGLKRSYCTPERYPGDSCVLYHNRKGQGFEDATRRAGVYESTGKALGVSVLDYNGDGWPDIAVANDTERNFLFTNNRDGTFNESGVQSSMAYSESGATRGGMGIDVGDLDGDGNDDVVIGNFAQEMAAFYRSTGRGFFYDDAARAGLGMPSLMSLTFGLLVVDFDSDGNLDIVLANGHIEPEIARLQPHQSYAQTPQFFRNDGTGSFRNLATAGEAGYTGSLVARGLACGDLDHDGDPDLVFTQNGGPVVVLRNDASRRSWVGLHLSGKTGSGTCFGTVVRAYSGKKLWKRSLNSGRSYLSSCEPSLLIGLGQAASLERLEIEWPTGTRQVLDHPAINRYHHVMEP